MAQFKYDPKKVIKPEPGGSGPKPIKGEKPMPITGKPLEQINPKPGKPSEVIPPQRPIKPGKPTRVDFGKKLGQQPISMGEDYKDEINKIRPMGNGSAMNKQYRAQGGGRFI